MTHNLKALGLALVAVCTLGVVGAQGASAAQEHEFHFEEERAVVTGLSEGTHKFAIGAAGTVECNLLSVDSTQVGTNVSANTYKADTITVTPHYAGCTFGGQPATVNFNHCAYVFDSDTTTGNSTGGEHANVEIECANGEKIQMHTAVCTVTIAAQVVEHSIRYRNFTGTETTVEITAKKIEVGKTRTTVTQPVNGCLTFPTGAVATYTGNLITGCFEDVGSALSGTDRTTPSTQEGSEIKCAVT